MFDKLSELMKSKGYASFYSNPNNTESFAFGRVLAMTDGFLAIYMISPDGYYDGILAKRVADIFRIEVGGQYSKGMSILIDDSKLPTMNAPVDTDNIPAYLLHMSKKERQVIAIELINSGIDDIVGIVEEINDRCISVFQIDAYGHADGMGFCRLQDITQIAYMSQSEQRVLKLWEKNNTLKNE